MSPWQACKRVHDNTSSTGVIGLCMAVPYGFGGRTLCNRRSKWMTVKRLDFVLCPGLCVQELRKLGSATDRIPIPRDRRIRQVQRREQLEPLRRVGRRVVRSHKRLRGIRREVHQPQRRRPQPTAIAHRLQERDRAIGLRLYSSSMRKSSSSESNASAAGASSPLAVVSDSSRCSRLTRRTMASVIW